MEAGLSISFLSDDLELVRGYTRLQGVVTRPDENRPTDELLDDAELRMVNRNRGSGTRILIDELLGDRRPDGYAYEPRSHYAVAAAVAAGKPRMTGKTSGSNASVSRTSPASFSTSPSA